MCVLKISGFEGIQKRGDIGVHIANSLYTAETNRTL